MMKTCARPSRRTPRCVLVSPSNSLSVSSSLKSRPPSQAPSTRRPFAEPTFSAMVTGVAQMPRYAELPASGLIFAESATPSGVMQVPRSGSPPPQKYACTARANFSNLPSGRGD